MWAKRVEQLKNLVSRLAPTKPLLKGTLLGKEARALEFIEKKKLSP